MNASAEIFNQENEGQGNEARKPSHKYSRWRLSMKRNRANNESWRAKRRERPIFGPATSLFVGHRSLRTCSLLTPRGRPKSLAAPSAPIYEMASIPLTNIPLSQFWF